MLDKAELLLPAGSLVKLKTAILYGADAVYAGTPVQNDVGRLGRRHQVCSPKRQKNLPDLKPVYA